MPQPYKLKQTLTGHKRSISFVKFSDNGNLIATSSARTWSVHIRQISSPRIHRSRTRNLRRRIFLRRSIPRYCFRRQNCPSMGCFHRRTSQNSIRTHKLCLMCQLQSTIESNMIVSGSFDETVRVWDVKTGKCLKVLPTKDLKRAVNC